MFTKELLQILEWKEVSIEHVWHFSLSPSENFCQSLKFLSKRIEKYAQQWKIVKRVDFTLHLKGCNRYQGCISYVCERNFYAVVFSKSMSCKYFHVRSDLGLIGFEYFFGKKLFMLKEIKYQKQI